VKWTFDPVRRRGFDSQKTRGRVVSAV